MSPNAQFPVVALIASASTLALAAVGLGCDDVNDRSAPLVVLAASSLTEVFTELAQNYEAQAGVPVRLSFAGSQALRLQVEQGARADVFASANEEHVEELQRAGLAEPPRAFASNDLMIIVPRDNPAQLSRFTDLPRAGSIIVGAPSVPVGRYTREVIANARSALGDAFSDAVNASVVSQEHNSRLVRAKVALGDADAALVYRTDATHPQVTAIEIPSALNARARYAISALSSSRQRERARAFADFVVAAEDVVRAHGFGRD